MSSSTTKITGEMIELLWVTKTAESRSLSHSHGQEYQDILSQAQRTSRRQKAATLRRSKANNASKSSPTTSTTSREIAASSGSKSYDDSVSHTSNPESRRSSDSSNLSPARSWSPSVLDRFLAKDPDWTSAERRSATYFQEVAVYKILTLQRDKNFWKEMVPCSAELYSGIRHLVVAIAATYELLFRPDSHQLNQFALEQCNKALRSILSSNGSNNSLLITSCILVSAYSLLRSDVETADKSIESGLKMSESVQADRSDANLEQLSGILTSLGKQHAYKLWSPDVTFRIDRTVVGHESLILSSSFPKGPFLDAAHVLSAFKTIIIEIVAKPLRNLTLGAHIDPDCLWAQHASQNFSDVFFHWDMYYRSLGEDRADEKLQLIQLKIGLLNARILFNTKLIDSNEWRDNAYIQSYAEIVRLGQEVISARHANRPVIYLDRIVNGALYTSSMFCRDPRIRRQSISLLKGQLIYTDGLVNFLRGHLAEIVASIEEHGLVVKNCYDVPEDRRIRLSSQACQENRVLYIEYIMVAQTDRSNYRSHSSRLPSKLSRFTVQEIDGCLKGMIAAYTMYRKLDLSDAPRGYLRKMYYAGRPVRVLWRPDLANEYGMQ